MFNHRHPLITSTLVWLILACAAPFGRAQDTSSFNLKDDDRLASRLSLAAPRLPIGDFVTRLSAASGVKIVSGEMDGSSDVEIAAFGNSVTVSAWMDALRSLVSYQKGEWQWERFGAPGSYEYRLILPQAAQQYGDTILKAVWAKYDAEAAALLQLSELSAKERRESIGKFKEDLHPENSQFIQALTDDANDRHWNHLRLLKESVPAERLKPFLHGKETIRVPLESVSAEQRARILKEFERAGATQSINGGPREPTPKPKWVEFYTRHDTVSEVPMTFFQIEGIGGPAIIGGVPLQDDVRRMLERLWLVDGDTAENEQELKPANLAAVPQNKAPNGNGITDTLEQLSRQAEIPLLARLPLTPEQQWKTGARAGATVKDMLAIHAMPYLMHKWKGDVLLISYQCWNLDSQQPPPWNTKQWLRQLATQSGGFLTLTDLMEVCKKLDVNQLSRLAAEFDVWRSLLPYRTLFARMAEDKALAKALLSDEGKMLRTMASDLADTPFAEATRIPALGDIRLRIREVVGAASPDTREYQFQLLNGAKPPAIAGIIHNLRIP